MLQGLSLKGSPLQRDRLIATGALVTLAALAWVWLAIMAQEMPDPGAAALVAMHAAPWNLGYFLATFLMWVVMMVGMMLPSAMPAILLFTALQRHKNPGARRILPGTAWFTAGYLLAWTAFSLAATFAQWGLATVALLSPAMVGTSPIFGGALFIAAGIYQRTPMKAGCLRYCRSPAEFLVRHRHAGALGPLLTGLEHGLYCTGCCWALMALLFTFGVMNLLWVAVISLFVLVEKLAPATTLSATISAVLMIATGVLLWIPG